MEKIFVVCSNYLDGSCSIIFFNVLVLYWIEIFVEVLISFVCFFDRCVLIFIVIVNMICICIICICISVLQFDMIRIILFIIVCQIMLLIEFMFDRLMRVIDVVVDVLYCYCINLWYWFYFFVIYCLFFFISIFVLCELF